MKYVWMIAGLLSGLSTVGYAMEGLLDTFKLNVTITMPNKQVLRENLKEFAYFCQKTNLIEELADIEAYPLQVETIIEDAFETYKAYIINNEPSDPKRNLLVSILNSLGFKDILRRRESELYEAAFKHAPEVLRQIRDFDKYVSSQNDDQN